MIFILEADSTETLQDRKVYNAPRPAKNLQEMPIVWTWACEALGCIQTPASRARGTGSDSAVETTNKSLHVPETVWARTAAWLLVRVKTARQSKSYKVALFFAAAWRLVLTLPSC